MVISGTLLVLAIPLRSYQNLFFRGKMILLVVAGLNAWIFHSRIYPKIAGWGADGVPPKAGGGQVGFRSSCDRHRVLRAV
jgi:hypothetical protein